MSDTAPRPSEMPAPALPRFSELQRCRHLLLGCLRSAMSERKDFPGTDWIAYERDCITAGANAWATAHAGCKTITVDEVERVEQLAVGHIDYAEKLALYVSELVYGLRVVAP